nr:unnamed protein product [Callosobruchus chinensis]
MVIGSLGGMRNTLLSALRAIPVCRAAAHILAARMQKAVILRSLRLLRAHDTRTQKEQVVVRHPLNDLSIRYSNLFNLARVDSSSPLCWSQAQEKREGWKPHFCKTTHSQNPQRNTTHRHQPRNSDLFKFFRGRTPELIAWAVAMNKPG